MKKRILSLFFALIVFLALTACGSSSNSGSKSTSLSETDSEDMQSSSAVESDSSAPIDFKDITWDVSDVIVDGDRCVALSLTNNTDYAISYFEIEFKQKADVSEEDLETFYNDLIELFGLGEDDEDDLNTLKSRDFSIYAETEKVVKSGSSLSGVPCCYYSGYLNVQSMEHYGLVEPDMATVKYVADGQIYTCYYDFVSQKLSVEDKTVTAVQWSTQPIGDKIPQPDTVIIDVGRDDSDIFTFDAYGIDLEQFNTYVEQCKEMGYVIDESSYEGFYSANNDEGYNIYLSHDEDDDSIYCAVEAPDEPAEEPLGTESQDTADDSTAPSGIRPEFQDAMDSYEAFYDDYIDLLQQYSENPTDMTLLSEYMDMMGRVLEMDEQFDAWEDDDLSTEEALYFSEVSLRISQKLIEAAQYMQ